MAAPRQSRRKKAKPEFENINFLLPADMKAALEAKAEEQVVSTSHLLRQLVRVYLKNGSGRPVLTPTSSGGAGASGPTRL